MDSVTEDLVWDIVGDRKIQGKDIFSEELIRMKKEKASELIIERILTHRREGAASGVIKMENGKEYAFSDIYSFSEAKGAKVKSINSYVFKI